MTDLQREMELTAHITEKALDKRNMEILLADIAEMQCSDCYGQKFHPRGRLLIACWTCKGTGLKEDSP